MKEITKEEILAFKKAGKIAYESIQLGKKLIKPETSMCEVLNEIEENILAKGGEIAFPAQISLNNIAAHFCPTLEGDVKFKEGDIAKLDLGVHINGRIADTAVTVNLGEHDELTKASKEALNQALKIIRPGQTLGEIGKTIQETIQSFGYSPVRNLSGHGLGTFQIHTKPSIPNINTCDDTELEENQVIAIEPFASTGAGIIYESSNPTIFSHVANKPVRNNMTRTVFKTIQSYNKLPFTTRWLTKIHGIGKTTFALRELQSIGNLVAHPPLPDKDHGIVSQHEHSVIVKDKPIIYTKNQD